MFEIGLLIVLAFAFLVPVLIKELWPIIWPFVFLCVCLAALPYAALPFIALFEVASGLLESLVETYARISGASTLAGYKVISAIVFLGLPTLLFGATAVLVFRLPSKAAQTD
jgi:hypothetical protein